MGRTSSKMKEGTQRQLHQLDMLLCFKLLLHKIIETLLVLKICGFSKSYSYSLYCKTVNGSCSTALWWSSYLTGRQHSLASKVTWFIGVWGYLKAKCTLLTQQHFSSWRLESKNRSYGDVTESYTKPQIVVPRIHTDTILLFADIIFQIWNFRFWTLNDI